MARFCYDLNPEQLVAVGANCLAPRLVESLFKGINNERKHNPVPLIVYPNSGENYNIEYGYVWMKLISESFTKASVIVSCVVLNFFSWIDRDKCEPVANYIRKWLDLGITWVGGCCRTYAIDITNIRNEVCKWQREHVKKDKMEPPTNGYH